MTTVLRTIVIAVAVAATMTTGAAAKAPSPADVQQTLAKRINEIRASHGLARLKPAPRLMRTARGWAEHMARNDRFGHGTTYVRAGFRRSGEIIALTPGRALAVRTAIRLWMRSPGHRALILDRSFRYIGTGPARSTTSTYWVVHFGAH